MHAIGHVTSEHIKHTLSARPDVSCLRCCDASSSAPAIDAARCPATMPAAPLTTNITTIAHCVIIAVVRGVRGPVTPCGPVPTTRQGSILQNPRGKNVVNATRQGRNVPSAASIIATISNPACQLVRIDTAKTISSANAA